MHDPTAEQETGVRIESVTQVNDELVESLAVLLPQLSSASPPGAAELTEIVDSPAVTLLVARDPTGSIVGTLTLAMFRIPTGVRAWIEDVVVDEAARGRGVGEALTLEALGRARDGGARTIELTSRPARQAADRLYRRLGFGRRDTNVYRREL